MMINRQRGEIAAELGGKQRCLCLTLGALSHLETSLGAGDLSALSERFSSGKLSSEDLLSIIHAGLLGGGHTFTRQDVSQMQALGGLSGYANIAAELLKVTFGQADEQAS